MKCQSLYFRKNKKNVINISSAELAYRIGKIKSSIWDVQQDKDNTWSQYTLFIPKFEETERPKQMLTLVTPARPPPLPRLNCF